MPVSLFDLAGYVDIREGAHSFWWLYGSTAATPRENTPLVMWLQGGPGASSTGFGNFNEIGPTALLANGSLAPRDSSWLQLANLLFLDNPVGTGWSYVDDPKYLTVSEGGGPVASYPVDTSLPPSSLPYPTLPALASPPPLPLALHLIAPLPR